MARRQALLYSEPFPPPATDGPGLANMKLHLWPVRGPFHRMPIANRWHFERRWIGRTSQAAMCALRSSVSRAHSPIKMACSSFRAAMRDAGTTLSMFRTQIKSPATLLRFCNNAPCPPGRNNNPPWDWRTSSCFSKSHATVSVEGCWTEVVMLR